MKLSNSPILNFIRRVLWLVLSIANWVIYAATFVVVFTAEVIFLFFILPIIWVVVGMKNTEKVYDALFTHSNEKLWYVEPWERCGHEKFESIIPIHGKYIQEKLIDFLLPENDYIHD